jgi:hypothetical protein
MLTYADVCWRKQQVQGCEAKRAQQQAACELQARKHSEVLTRCQAQVC